MNKSKKLMQIKDLFRLFIKIINSSSNDQRKLDPEIFAFENILGYPIIFTDKHDLKYILYPGQNAQVYFQNNGNYELAETNYCLKEIKKGMTVFDIGANIGLYSLLFAKLVSETGTVHAFEPDYKNFRRLVTNIYINGFETIVKPHNKAVFSKTQKVKLNTFPDSVNSWHTMGNLTLPNPWVPGKTISPILVQEIQAISINDYCHENNIERIDFLKVDVEGAELDVFEGASKLFRLGKINKVLFEISLPQIQSMSHKPEDIFHFFKKYFYNIYRIQKDGSISNNLNNTDEVCINYVAIRKN